jgi:putative membrane protein
MFERKRLHPIAVVSNVLKQLKELIFPILAVTVFGGGSREWSAFIIPIGAVIFALVYGIINWFRYSYRIEENEIRIESGVFVRKKRYIPFERIQSLNQSEGILQRPFGLVKLKIETAGKGGKNEAEAELAAISKEEASRIQKVLTEIKNTEVGPSLEVNSNQNVVYKISSTELFLLAITSGGVGVIISAVIAFLAQFSEMIPYGKLFHRFEKFITNGILFISLIVLLILLVVWMFALVGMMLKYANFTVIKSGDDLVISRGFIERRQITIPFKRIQAIRVSQNLIRQPLGFATVFLENAGSSVENDGKTKIMILPLVKRNEIQKILKRWLPDYQLEVNFESAPKRALRRYLIKGWLVILPIILIPQFFLNIWGWVLILLIIPVSFLQYWTYRDAGWNLEGDQLTLQYRSINKNTVYFKKGKIQSLGMDESYFQSKKGLATIHATAKSGPAGADARVVDVERDHADEIFGWFSYEKK